MKRTLLIYMITTLNLATLNAQMPVNWSDEAADTTHIAQLMAKIAELPERGHITAIAGEFIGRPYGPGTLERVPERVTVNLDTLDCTTLVDNVLALEKTLREGRSGWRDFIYNLESMRYRQGKVDGWASRMHYVSDWIVDNTSRGNLMEVTADLPCAEYKIKTLDYVTSHRKSYPSLGDESQFQRMRNVEASYRSHRYPMVPSAKVNRAVMSMLREGDVVALTSKLDGLDVAHLGIVTLVDGVPHLLHASSKAGKVIVDPLPLDKYLHRNRQFTGIRVLRLTD